MKPICGRNVRCILMASYKHRCPACRTRRVDFGLFTAHIRATGHKPCWCSGYWFAHRPGSPYCEYNPLSALRMADRYGAGEDDLIRCALSILSETPALAPKVQALLKDWNIDAL